MKIEEAREMVRRQGLHHQLLGLMRLIESKGFSTPWKGSAEELIPYEDYVVAMATILAMDVVRRGDVAYKNIKLVIQGIVEEYYSD